MPSTQRIDSLVSKGVVGRHMMAAIEKIMSEIFRIGIILKERVFRPDSLVLSITLFAPVKDSIAVLFKCIVEGQKMGVIGIT
jgi:hypothetical protein